MSIFAKAGDYDPRALKQSINLAGVVMLAGVALSSAGDGRLVGKCPFHEDEHESFAVWQWEDGDGAWTCGCWACSPFEGRSGGTRSNGDVFDFLQALYGLTFGQAVERVLELKDEVLPTEPQAAVSLGPTPDLGRALEAASGPSNRSGLLPQLLADRGVNVPATWLYDSWLVADGTGEVLIPHYDAYGTLTAVKHRSSEDGWAGRSMRGSRLEALYGVWRARGGRSRPVVLCEGESDTWTVSWLLDGEPVDVVGLPSGASAGIKDTWLDFVAGRSLTLLLDADRAGREGAGRWAAAAVGRAGDVRIASLPDGTDATSAGHDIVMKALDEAWPVIDLKSLPIYAKDGRYFRHGKITEDKETGEETEAVTIVSDFVLDPRRLVTMDDGGIVFECEVPGRQGVQRLTDAELAGVDRMRRWAAARMLSWKGTPRDLSDLLELLKAQSILIPRFRGTDVIGLHGNVFVLPDSSIGASGWGYVPPENDIDLGHSIKLDGTGWDRALPGQLARLHDPKVITPILGWIAAAPLRSIVTKFPVLGITGGSGFGKALALDTPIPTPTGWTTMGEIQTGDFVFDEAGNQTRVVYTSPVFADHECYRITFSNGDTIVADADHLWEVAHRGSDPKVRSTHYLATHGQSVSNKYKVVVNQPLEMPALKAHETFFIDPYILGYWLGDGDSRGARFTVHNDDLPNLLQQVEAAGYVAGTPRPNGSSLNSCRVHVSTSTIRRGKTDTLQTKLRALGVLNNKHIPRQYLRGSVEQRLALLQGLMDSDGSVSGNQCEFTNTNLSLAAEVLELTRTLGIRSTTYFAFTTQGKPYCRISFGYPDHVTVFRLARKLRTHSPQRKHHYIESIVRAPSVPTRCIAVDSPNHLFLAGESMIPTHNTTLLETVLGAFGFWTTTPTTLTGATAHGIQSYAGSTNSFPIWIDEYRPGARIDAKLALDQIIRDSWDGSSTIKGGMSENRMKIAKLPARAPLVVTGEDSFSETSHSERMVIIPMPKDGKNVRALVRVQAMANGGLGHAYLEWLLDSLKNETIPAAPMVPDRKTQARAVAEWGYELLGQFCHEVCGYSLPTYDDSLAAKSHADIEETPVIVEAILAALERYDANQQIIATADGDDVYLKPISLVQWVTKNTDIQLPGRSAAVTTWLIQQFGAERVRHQMHGRVLFVPGILKEREEL